MARSLYLLVYDSLPTYVCSDGLHYFNGHGSCDALCKHVNTSARFLKKKENQHVLRCTAIREVKQ